MFVVLLLSVSVLGNPLQTSLYAAAASPQSGVQKSKSTAKNESANRQKSRSATDSKSAAAVRKSKKSTAASRSAPKARMPRFFSQLDLDDAQRKEVLEIQGQFAAQIAQLQQEIAQMQVERNKQLDAVLKSPQKRLLKQLRTPKDARKE